jgi:hypothetical protein
MSVRELWFNLSLAGSVERKSEKMEKTHKLRLLTVQEASLLLQRFMPHKNAQVWLAHDRQFDPAIPFSHRGGEVFYRSVDLENFVQHHLLPHSGVDFSDRRAREDRRMRVERRRTSNLRLTPAAERRRAYANDRREEFDRRPQQTVS